MIQRDLDQQLFLPSQPHFVVRLLYTHPTQSVILSLVSKCLILATPTSPIGRRGVIGSIAVSSYPRRPLWTASLRLLPSSSRGPIPAYIRGASKDLRANTDTGLGGSGYSRMWVERERSGVWASDQRELILVLREPRS